MREQIAKIKKPTDCSKVQVAIKWMPCKFIR